jgi:hypothetical protein
MKVRDIAERILADMGGDAAEICTGECTTFAKRLVDVCGGEIVADLNADMMGDLDGYAVIEPEYSRKKIAPHCWVKIDGLLYDAFNPEGVDDESLLDYFEAVS